MTEQAALGGVEETFADDSGSRGMRGRDAYRDYWRGEPGYECAFVDRMEMLEWVMVKGKEGTREQAFGRVTIGEFY